MKIQQGENPQKGLRKKTDKDYGIIQMPYPDDVLYRLTFDKDERTLLLNDRIIVRFKFEMKPELTFQKLFKKRGNPRRIILENKGDANYIIRNIGLPKQLQRAMFKTYLAGKKMEVYTEITRKRAHDFELDDTAIRDYMYERDDYHNRANR